jgi:hypothetical protein
VPILFLKRKLLSLYPPGLNAFSYSVLAQPQYVNVSSERILLSPPNL